MPTKPSKTKEEMLNFRLPSEMHERLRVCAFKEKKHMAEICREGIEIILRQYEKRQKSS